METKSDTVAENDILIQRTKYRNQIGKLQTTWTVISHQNIRKCKNLMSGLIETMEAGTGLLGAATIMVSDLPKMDTIHHLQPWSEYKYFYFSLFPSTFFDIVSLLK
jgi:hypothetical protein